MDRQGWCGGFSGVRDISPTQIGVVLGARAGGSIHFGQLAKRPGITNESVVVTRIEDGVGRWMEDGGRRSEVNRYQRGRIRNESGG
jgi:hypothetical protein